MGRTVDRPTKGSVNAVGGTVYTGTVVAVPVQMHTGGKALSDDLDVKGYGAAVIGMFAGAGPLVGLTTSAVSMQAVA